ncbi:urea ABC transporter permease subunit UrtB [Limnohabitans sp. Rim8]|uniref:urea ABC transporter permease subunit UrtB n=1 Tax=Limnohabitans sp. Rim8 TaxID=1100718 RepID=UPI0025FE1393|nr:urea ABC transporter permease subunit UrtB [Limnohabitans sp. Rim8]
MNTWIVKGACIASVLWGLTAAHALTMDEALGIAVGDSDARIEALSKAVAQGNDKTAVYLQALADDVVKIANGQVLVVRDGQGTDPVTGQAVTVPPDAEDVMLNNRLRGEVDTALAALKLFSPEVKVRRQAALALLKEPDASRAPLLEKALSAEKDPAVQSLVRQARAAALLGSEVPNDRLLAARELAGSRQPETLLLLNQQLSQEQEPSVKQQIQKSLAAVQDSLRWGERLGTLFTGASLGSILLLVALGLAITYGLMGVINMAHGELMMIGAYATYVVQALFREHLPGAFDAYLAVAIPVAFLTSALVGAVMERTVIQHLYGRPLETLLATWGISLVLMQGVRSLFGAQNVGVENPSWMSGSLQLLPNLQLPWNRVLIIVFAAAVLIGVALLISKTRLGLFVRGVTQNRPMASCMGVNTARIDTYAFALGSGIAGLAGCALSQVGNVGPDLGQSYIVDSFMVVVLGGVGQLAGTVYAALGLGLANKLLEGWTGAVLAKIAVLVFIIVFIQKRPQGIFAMKGRSAEA